MIESVTLIFPRLKYKSGDPPLGICYIASHLKKKYSNLKIKILDSTFQNSFKKIITGIKNDKPQAVGIYIDAVMYSNARELIKTIKEYTPLVIAGGPQATVSPQSLIDVADIVVRGEAEKTMSDLIERLPNNDIRDIPGVYLKNRFKSSYTQGNIERLPLDDLEIPALQLLDNLENYMDYWHYLDPLDPKLRGLNVMASRGCLYDCNYCQPTLRKIFGPGLRYKSPQFLVNELQYYINNFNISNFYFHDDTLPSNREWIKNFCNIILKNTLRIMWGCNSRIDTVDCELLELMHKAGLRVIHYGIESASQRVLDKVYNKGINIRNIDNVINMTKAIGILPSGFFMIGAPSETTNEILKTIFLSLRLGIEEASFSITTPFIGTTLYENVKKTNKHDISQDFSQFDYYSKISFKNKTFSAYKISFLQKAAVILFYINPMRLRYILRHFKTFRSSIKLINKIGRFF